MRAIFAALRNPKIDPRVALAIDLGGEQRLGQVIRSRRSQLILDNAVNNKRLPWGVLYVEGCGKKQAAPVALFQEQRAHLDEALTGYLSDYEARWLSEGIDYPLFPAGRLVRGKAKPVANPKPLTEAAVGKKFREIECIAGVTHQSGRGWYGIRRQTSRRTPNGMSVF